MILSTRGRTALADSGTGCVRAAALAAAFACLAWTGTAGAADCLETAYGASTNCTANDFAVSLISVTNVDLNDCGGATDSFTFDGEFEIGAGSADRYDVGFYLGANGLQSLTGTDCAVNVIPQGNGSADDGDACGDYDGSATTVAVNNVTVKCKDTDNNGFFDVALCSAWHQNGSPTCNGAADAVPGTSSKCDCAVVNTTVQVPECASNAECAADANVCTDAVCVGIGSPGADSFGCTQVNNTASCDDGLFCNGADTCSGGACGHTGDPCTGGGVCGDNCNESADNCFDAAGTPCRAADGACDLAETCTGSDEDCPADAFQQGGVCRAADGACDVAESCSGASADCPADGFADASTTCRQAAGECDAAETCTGSDADCPADASAPADTPCSSDGNVCTDDACDGAGQCAHENNTAPCDDGAGCTENDVCSGGACAGVLVDCGDAIDCTVDSCNENTDSCVHTPNHAACGDEDPCTANVCSVSQGGCTSDFVCGTDICRSPGYWSTHSGYEKANSVNVGQLLLDLRGPFEVCGQTVSATSNVSSPFVDGLGLTSNLEGLCMRARGVKQRQLYRQLLAARFNCEASGSSDCDAISGKYIEVNWSDCDSLCAGSPVADGPTAGECVEQLGCFNNGGLVVDGQCAKGTCESEPDVNCGGDFGDCPAFNDAPQACVPFPGNCHDAALCNEPLGFCPKSTPASSSSACRQARGNGCTIDACF